MVEWVAKSALNFCSDRKSSCAEPAWLHENKRGDGARMKQNQSGGIAGTVRALLEDKIEQMGYFLWDVEYVKEGASYYLRVTIDDEEGINIDDCEKVHRAIDPILDEADPIDQAYILEVSSHGIERELRTDAHLMACEGWQVEVRLYAPLDGSKVYRGVLQEYIPQEGILFLTMPDGSEKQFPRESVSKISTVYDFGD